MFLTSPGHPVAWAAPLMQESTTKAAHGVEQAVADYHVGELEFGVAQIVRQQRHQDAEVFAAKVKSRVSQPGDGEDATAPESVQEVIIRLAKLAAVELP